VPESIGNDIFKAVAATRQYEVLHEESPIATTRDICTSFYARGTLGPEPLVKQTSKELKTISHPLCQNRLERTSSKQQTQQETIKFCKKSHQLQQRGISAQCKRDLGS